MEIAKVALALVLAGGTSLALQSYGLRAMAAPTAPTTSGSPALASPSGPAAGLQLKVRRQPNAVELLIEGTGPGPQLRQSLTAAGWSAELSLLNPSSLRLGGQSFSLPELGLQSVALAGSGSRYQLQVTPAPGQALGWPVISADGRQLIVSFTTAAQLSSQSGRLDLRVAARVPQPNLAPALQTRAVAPPLGDMAVGTMVLRNRSYLNLSGPPVSMTIRNAPARDVLMSLAPMGGYGFVYVNDSPAGNGSNIASKTSQAEAAAADSLRKVSMAFQMEPYARAINAVLMAAGWQGRLEGRLIMAGPSVSNSPFGVQVSKVYRLNQASANSAADYLASLGAQITKVTVITNSVTQGTPVANQVAGAATSQQTETQNVTTTQSYGSSIGPLKGLKGATDSRLQTITLVGDSALVAVAEGYLRQIDLRQRQVALSVKILDISLNNQTDINNSFAFRYGNNFIVNDSGRLVGAFGTPYAARALATFDPANPGNPKTLPADANSFPPNNFVDFLQAQISSTNTKVLASPTLILSENQEEVNGGSAAGAQLSTGNAAGSSGSSSSDLATIGRPRANEAFVTVGEQVITNYQVSNGTQGNGNSCQPSFGIAGLTFGARVSRIDDNGFVTFTLSPQITAKTKEQLVGGCGPIDILAVRRLDTGSARVRDGQTLILTGVISDSDLQVVSKWPILGDIPLVGQFFRNSTGQRQKRELVIMVTPRILDDDQGGTYGYGYQPSSREARSLVGDYPVTGGKW
jgi:type IV pilus assembly protein PilQ